MVYRFFCRRHVLDTSFNTVHCPALASQAITMLAKLQHFVKFFNVVSVIKN